MKHKTGLLKNELCLGMYASCFGPFIGHHQTHPFKNLMKEDV